MIAKEYTASPTQDRFQRAGDQAEKQMAFYLKRAFGDDPAVQVFHNLRLEDGGEVAQLDHLVLHRNGAIIVESKSVTSSVRINERDEWTREWGGRWTGMPSPVLQARRQADLLRKILRARKEELLSKAIFGLVQRGYGMFVFDVVVAISDQGVIQHRGALPDVRKADQVQERVCELMREQAALASPTSRDPRSKEWGMTLKPEEMTRTTAFLRAAHRGRPAAATSPATTFRPVPSPPPQTHGRHAAPRTGPVHEGEPYMAVGPVNAAPVRGTPAVAPSSSFTCQKCSSTQLEIAYGKYGYYFKCSACDSNTRIELKCPGCGGKPRTRKSGREFFAECAPCNHSKRYFVNPA
ncbi:NERD domain-containing protein [Deinococcus sp. UYEF24]